MKRTTKLKIKQKTELLIETIQLFKDTEKDFIENVSYLVHELIDLYRIEDPSYSFSSLLQEKALEDYSDIIDKYVPYNISPKVTKLYHEGKLDNTDLMVLANTDKEFQEPEKQDKIVTKILTKEIKATELIRATKNEIGEMIGEETNELDEAHTILLQCIYQIEQSARHIEKWNGKFKKLLNKKNKKKLIDNFNHLRNQLRFNLKIKV